jgi:hypothetical protein
MTRVAEQLRRSRTAGSGGFDRRLIAPMILGSILNEQVETSARKSH